MRVGLGTVQFGLDYGVSNTAGQVAAAEVPLILQTAAREGVSVIDTAAAYGNSESVLGQALPTAHAFELVTKLPRLPAAVPDAAAWVEETVSGSLGRLRVAGLYGLLMHDAKDLLNEKGAALFEALTSLKRRGIVKKIGASLYTGAEADALIARYPVDLVQLPINLLDQRLLRGGQLDRLKHAGVEVHARSLFLQGLLLMPPAQLPPHFISVRPILDRFGQAAAGMGLSRLAAAVAFASSVEQIDVAVFGVTKNVEFEEILAAHKQSLPRDWYAGFSVDDERILSPNLWPKFR